MDCNNSSEAPEQMVIRRCHKCGTFDTPLWRTGPDGPKTLCNACGLRYKKEVKLVDTTLALGSLNSKMPGNYLNKSS